MLMEERLKLFHNWLKSLLFDHGASQVVVCFREVQNKGIFPSEILMSHHMMSSLATVRPLLKLPYSFSLCFQVFAYVMFVLQVQCYFQGPWYKKNQQ